jgi:hypothetical protein
MRPQWWLTVAYRPGLCSDCGSYHRKDAPIFFRASKRQVLCRRCGERRGIHAEASAAYRASPHNDERPAVAGRSSGARSPWIVTDQSATKEVREG